MSKDLSVLIQKKVVTIFNPCFFKLYKRKITNDGFLKILNVARFEKQKDHMTLLRAISISPLKNIIKLSLVGYGTHQKKIIQYAKKNNIHYKIFNNKTKLNKLYKSHDLFVMSSIYEGLPTAMIEAASYRLPLISSNFKSGAKEILNNGKSGFVFNIGDYNSLSTLLSKFYFSENFFLKKEKLCSKNILKFSNKKNFDIS